MAKAKSSRQSEPLHTDFKRLERWRKSQNQMVSLRDIGQGKIEFFGHPIFVPSSIFDATVRDAQARLREKEGKRKQLSEVRHEAINKAKKNAAEWVGLAAQHAEKLWSPKSKSTCRYTNYEMAESIQNMLKGQGIERAKGTILNTIQRWKKTVKKNKRIRF